jgi:hypothetical protein
MADLTAAAPLRFHNLEQCHIRSWTLDSSAAQSVYRGQPMIIDQSEDTVNVRGFVDATTVAATDIFVGIALENKTVLIGAAETAKVQLVMHGLVGFKSAVFTDADVGDTVYMSDSATLSATVGDNPQLGVLAYVEDGYAYVMINPNGAPTICSGA